MPYCRFIALLLISATSTWAHFKATNLSEKELDTGIEPFAHGLPYVTYPEPAAVAAHTYGSEHFNFISRSPLDGPIVDALSQLCEATRVALHELPLEVTHTNQSAPFEIHLFHDADAYQEAGGIEGTGGIYLPGKKRTLIRLDLLSVDPRAEQATLCKRKSKMIIHEVTHQLQHEWLGKMPTWLVEGIAVYMESIPYADGRFDFNAIHFRGSEGINHCTTNRLSVTKLEKLMNMSGTDWLEHFEMHPHSVHRNYLSAYLLTYYFLHLEGEGDAASLCDYFSAMENAASRNAFAQADRHLMNGRSIAELEADLIQAYQDEGITLVPIKGYLLSSQQSL